MLEGGSAAVGVGVSTRGCRERECAAVGSRGLKVALRLVCESRVAWHCIFVCGPSHFGCLRDLTDLARSRIFATTAGVAESLASAAAK